MCFNIYVIDILLLLINQIIMRTIIWFASLFAVSAFIFTATVNAANNIADNYLDKAEQRATIEELMLR